MQDCCHSCGATIPPVQIPGPQGTAGTAGAAGTDGVNSFTFTSADFDIPLVVGDPVTFSVLNSTWAIVGQTIIASDGTNKGTFEVLSKPSLTSIQGEWLDFAGDSAGGTTINSGAQVGPSGTQPVLAAPLPGDFTDNSAGTPSDTIAVGVGIQTLTIPLSSLATGLSTGALDLMTNYTPGYRFALLSFDFITTIVGAGAAASQTFNLEIGATNVTGGSLNVTLASTATVGAMTAGTAITAANIGSASDTLSIEMAAGGTVFTSGAGFFVIKIKNLDTADAFASLAEHVDELVAALT